MSSPIDPRRHGRFSFTDDSPSTGNVETEPWKDHPEEAESGDLSVSARTGDRKSQSRLTARSEWMSTVRCACQTLCQTPEEVIGSLSVTARVATLEEARSITEMARRIAEEFNVCARERRDGQSLTVQLRRQAPDSDLSGSSSYRERSDLALVGKPPSSGGVEQARLAAAAGTSVGRGILSFILGSVVVFRSRHVVDDQPRTTVR